MSPKVILVTGCSHDGIGFYLDVLCFQKSRALQLMIEYTMDGLKHPVAKRAMDDDVKLAVQSILEEQGKIDIVLNNGGAIAIGPLLDVSYSARKAFETNTFSVLRAAQAVAPSMQTRAHRQYRVICSQYNGLYYAIKEAVRVFTEVLTMECKPFGVKVMLVAPDQVRSNIAANQAAVLELSSTSIYEPYFDRVYDRMRGSQAKGNMPTDEFARRVVAKVLSPNPSELYTTWGRIGSFRILAGSPIGLSSAFWDRGWYGRRLSYLCSHRGPSHLPQKGRYDTGDRGSFR